MKIPAKVIDYSGAADKGRTVCLAVDKAHAAPLPHNEHLPPKAYVPIELSVNGVVYQARLFARPKVPYVWISTALERNGVKFSLVDVLRQINILPNDRVSIDVNCVKPAMERSDHPRWVCILDRGERPSKGPPTERNAQLRTRDTDSRAVIGIGGAIEFGKYPTWEEVAKGVSEYNSKYGKEDASLWPAAPGAAWYLSQPSYNSRLEGFVWDVKKWGRIQGVSLSDRPAAAKALWALRTQIQELKERSFRDVQPQVVVSLLEELVRTMQREGIRRDEYSWASKILHWLLPSLAPVYDSVVRDAFRLPTIGIRAYSSIVKWEYNCAVRLEPHGEKLFGDIEPRTLLRCIDKYLWWINVRKK